MEAEKMSCESMEIDRVPYWGLEECKDCMEKTSTVIEHRLFGNSGVVAIDTHLECAKLSLCQNVKRHILEDMQKHVLYGEGDRKPVGISRAEPPADG